MGGPNLIEVARQAGQKGMDPRVSSRSQVGPKSGRNWRTAIAILAGHRLYFTTAGAVILHRLPQTAGMRQGSRNRQGHRDKRARKQQHKQQPGGQAIHDWFGEPWTFELPATSIGDARPACKYPEVTEVTVVSGHVGASGPTQVEKISGPG